MFNKAPPPALTKDLLGRMIAWRIQEQFYGGHDKATLKLLDRLARGDATKTSVEPWLARRARHDAINAVASSGFSDSKMRPSFLSTTPAKNPRTECCCQPVTFMMAGIVEPCGRRKSSRTAACLDFARGLG
jgi:hypothetical protein